MRNYIKIHLAGEEVLHQNLRNGPIPRKNESVIIEGTEYRVDKVRYIYNEPEVGDGFCKFVEVIDIHVYLAHL